MCYFKSYKSICLFGKCRKMRIKTNLRFRSHFQCPNKQIKFNIRNIFFKKTFYELNAKKLISRKTHTLIFFFEHTINLNTKSLI